MRRTLKNSIVWLLLLVLLAGGCMMPSEQGLHDRVPSPTSALSEERSEPTAEPVASSEGVTLRFTEVRSAGSLTGAYEGCESEDWFELYNPGTEPVDLGRLFITDDPEKPDKRPLPQVVLEPGRYVAICCCEGEEHPSVPMGISRSGEILTIFGGDRRLIAQITVPSLGTDISWAFRDGTWGYAVEPTPGQPNGRVFASLDPVRVETLGFGMSELLIDGRYAAVTPDGQYSDFVELHNDTDGSISLKNWFLSDSEDDLDKWAFPDVTVPADGYLLVLLGGDGQPRADGLL